MANYFAHTQAVEIPIKDIKPLMRTDPLAPMASFDCSKAKTAIEKEICADWKLARADRFLNTVYGDKLRDITDPSANRAIQAGAAKMGERARRRLREIGI